MTETVTANVHFHRFADGRQLAWRESGSGPPLVLLHGWSMSGAVFSEVARLLAAEFRVLCPDLRGHGWSDPGEHYSLALLADDIAGWLGAIGLSRVALLGWSLGGQVAIALAGRPDLEISRLLLISTTPRFCAGDDWTHGLQPARLLVMRRQLQSSYQKTLGDFFDLQFADESLPPLRRHELLGFAVRRSRLALPEDCLAALEILSTGDYRPLLAAPRGPVLVLHGRQDRIVPWRAGRVLAETLPDSRWQLLEGVGHAPFMSRPELCVQLWREFLK
ncbi:MAG: alpha/beta fold hydrolase [Desulfuromonadales bacterium]|nr:alpha/beta fold hydrolase [Desulfuromonadales bacterium]